ncbi:P63C domain-containing protein [Pseudomonas sp.]|uniref:P63C domain-containing protein n=1 Tax=Pseudomonas sp. TaxID=306 RepID=UPI00257FE9E9|nr:P63C domain-containing protein [Pseudomonas sp.]
MTGANDPSGKAKGGIARAKSLTPQRRSEIARSAALAKTENAKLPKATHGSADHPLRIGDVDLPCYVLEDGTRILSQRGVMQGMAISRGSLAGGGDRLTALMESPGVRQFATPELIDALKNPVKFIYSAGSSVAYGYPATLLAEICDALLAARKNNSLPARQSRIADQAELLVRGFARVGIIALIDEATGYQKDRAKDALAQILEAFVAKELQPYVRTFPADYYEHLFRLRGLDYPPKNAKYRPQYFGTLTNDIVYKRLAPSLLGELKNQNAKDAKKGKLFQRLTTDTGHPKLREHLASAVTIMKLSKNYPDFIEKMNLIHPRYGDSLTLDLDEADV